VIVSLTRQGQLFNAQALRVPAGGTAQFVLDSLPAEPAVYEALLTPPASAEAGAALDALPLDDRAWAVFQPPAAGRVLLISPGNVFLEQGFAALAEPLGLRPFRLKAGEALPPDPFDLYVFDGVMTDTLPAGDLLLVNPPPGENALFTVGGVFTSTAGAQVNGADPLGRFVDWSGVHLLQARQVTLPDWARVVVQAEGGPLVFAGETGGRRVAVLTFDLHDSDLPLQVSFLALLNNLVGYLAPAQTFSAPDGLRPGETLTIRPRGGDTAVLIRDPAGQEFSARAAEAGVVFVDTHRLGVYQVVPNQGVLGSFAVNLFDPRESNIRPEAGIQVGRVVVPAAARQATGEYEIWPWLAALAFLLLLVEWWLYHRGATLPAASGWRGLFRRRPAVGSQ
jgi:hypothetical protein